MPIHKSGDSNKLMNFRPISILSSFSKVLEKIMYNQMVLFIDKFYPLSDSQFDFRRGYNTVLATICVLSHIFESRDKGIPSITFFIDVAKAFDYIDLAILLDKLHSFGFRGVCYSWFANYLSNRYQYVETFGTKFHVRVFYKDLIYGYCFFFLF